ACARSRSTAPAMSSGRLRSCGPTCRPTFEVAARDRWAGTDPPGAARRARAMLIGARRAATGRRQAFIMTETIGFIGLGAMGGGMLAGDFKPGGTVDISYKDQELETAFAKSLGMPLFLANVSQQVYQMARAAGLAKEDGAAVVKAVAEIARRR